MIDNWFQFVTGVFVVGFVALVALSLNVMWKRAEYKPIVGPDGSLYLERWTLLRLPGGWSLKLHRFHRPDLDRCLHDHPWKFWTLILWGGYDEEVGYPQALSSDEGMLTKRRRNYPGLLLFRPATHTHRILLLHRVPTYTLILAGPEEITWGFHTNRGWVRWTEFFEKAVLWCEGS